MKGLAELSVIFQNGIFGSEAHIELICVPDVLGACFSALPSFLNH